MPGDLSGGVAGAVAAEHRHPAAEPAFEEVGNETTDQPEQARLAAAGKAREHGQAPAGKLKRDVLQGRLGAALVTELLDIRLDGGDNRPCLGPCAQQHPHQDARERQHQGVRDTGAHDNKMAALARQLGKRRGLAETLSYMGHIRQQDAAAGARPQLPRGSRRLVVAGAPEPTTKRDAPFANRRFAARCVLCCTRRAGAM